MARIQYPRPSIEVEYDPDALKQEAGDRLIEICVRVCDMDLHNQGTHLSVSAQRLKFSAEDKRNIHDDPYNVRWDTLKPDKWDDLPHYREYHLWILGRPHSDETGLLHITFGAGGTLAEAHLSMDTRYRKPTFDKCEGWEKYGFRLVPLRSQQEREALRGRFPLPELVPSAEAMPTEAKSPSLFPQAGPFRHTLFFDMLISSTVSAASLQMFLDRPREDFDTPMEPNGERKYELSFETPDPMPEAQQQAISRRLKLQLGAKFNQPVE